MNDPHTLLSDLDPKRAKRPGLSSREQHGQGCTEQIIPRAPRNKEPARFPLSYAQQRLWFLDQLTPGNTTYNISTAVRLTGSLDVATLEQSLNEVIRRHETLRTTFATVEGQVIQIIAPTLKVLVSLVDLKEISETEREAEAQKLAGDKGQRPFDLARGPLVRAILVRLQEKDHLLSLAVHQIISDGWSTAILIGEMAALYQALTDGQPSPLSELPIQYADFVAWQREWLQGKVLDRQLSYWKQQLGGPLPMLKLPTDHPRPATRTFRGSRSWFALPRSLSEALRELGQREGCTLFMTLLAAFNTLLYRYTAQTDILVGSPVANRNRVEIEPLIGFFANTLTLRTDLSGNPTFRQLLARVRETTLDAYTHQDLPFEKLVEALQPERDLSHTPLFQVMFILQNAPLPSLELPGLTLRSIEVDSGTAKFDLTFSMVETEEGLAGSWEYNTDLFDDSTVSRMAGHFQTLLESIVADPERRIGDLPILTKAERHQLLVEWNNTQSAYPQDKCIHERVEAQAKRTPDAVAVVFEDQHLTYGELNRRANQVAHRLQRSGIGPEAVVGICVERSPEMIVGLLGVLKAGGAYVPLDPTYPQKRLAFMLEDAQAQILLTQTPLLGRLPVREVESICLDGDWEPFVQEPGDDLDSSVEQENKVYVIYTSGSTGNPKGVLSLHRALTHHCATFWKQYGLTSRDRMLQFSSLSFTGSIEQIFPPLITGASVVLRDKQVWDTAQFYKKMLDLSITIADIPTVYWHQLAQEWNASMECPPSLRLVLTGGEMMSPKHLGLWQQTPLKKVRIFNSYGLTESTNSTAFEIPLSLQENTSFHRIPIGRPMRNRAAYILDQNGAPLPMGVPGMLHIDSHSLAQGYLHQPSLTAETFTPNPFSNEPGRRLLKTGDIARYRQDGNIELLGRRDYQVKIRGFRVGLGEIEAALSQHEGVQTAVAMARKDEARGTMLVAYLVPRSGVTHTADALRRFLREKLPEYMVPSHFVMLDALPLNPNRKIDRKALPAPELSRPELETVYAAPRTPKETALSKIWAELLGLERVGIHDNFFDLGGHSLLATQFTSRLREALQVDLPLRYIFETPTVAGLSESIETIRWASLQAPPPARETGREEIEL